MGLDGGKKMDDLIFTYHDTDYHVFAEPPLILHTNTANLALDELLMARGATTAAFLTAWNPLSSDTPRAQNEAAQAALQADLTASGISWINGEGRGRRGDWPPEPSLLAIGIEYDAALALAQRYSQNAWLWAQAGQPVQLVLTSPDKLA